MIGSETWKASPIIDSRRVKTSNAPSRRTIKADTAAIKAWVSRLQRGAGGIVEIRVLNPRAGPKRTWSGYFDDPGAAADAALQWSGRAEGVYSTLNALDPALLARRYNRMQEAEQGTLTADKNVLRLCWIPLDFDPVRIAKTSSTEAQHEAARIRMEEVRAWFAEQGWSDPIVSDSGNGWHLLFPIDLPPAESARIKCLLEALQSRFGDRPDEAGQLSDNAVTIDTSVYNPARIWKCVGTLACKGDDLPDYPHRMATLVSAPDVFGIVTIQQIDMAIAALSDEPLTEDSPSENAGCNAETPLAQAAIDSDGRRNRHFDVSAFIARHDIEALPPRPYYSGSKWVLARCPFDPSHDNGCAVITQNGDGKLGFRCLHNSCSAYRWPDLRAKFEPEYRERRQRAQAGEEYVILPGEHHDAMGAKLEIGTAAFANDVLDRTPAGTLYRRGDKQPVVGTIEGHFRPATVSGMRIIVDSRLKLGQWVDSEEGDRVVRFSPCIENHAKLVLTAAEVHPRVRALRLITTWPTFLPDWTLAKPGWNACGATYYHPQDAFRSLRPVRDRDEIRSGLCELTVDFPFKSPADRDNFFGLLLTPLVRFACENVPLHLALASQPRVGKSLLLERPFGQIYLGRALEVTSLPRDEEELRKTITALLLEDSIILNVDNISRELDSPALAMLLTGSFIKGRVLGASTAPVLPNNLIVVGSGNNVSLSGEMAERTIPIRLDWGDDHPELREEFAHPDLRAYVDDVRAHVIACLAGAVLNWLEAGQPPAGKPLGGFDRWAHAVGGVLKLLGFDAWRNDEREWRRRADPAGMDLQALVDAWWTEYRDQPVSASELQAIAFKCEIFMQCFREKTASGQIVAFTKLVLRPNVDRPVGRHFIRRTPTANARYFLEEA